MKLSPHKTTKYLIANVQQMMEPDEKLAIYYPGKTVRHYKEWMAIEATAIFYTNNEIEELTAKRHARKYFEDPDANFCIVRNTYLGDLKRELKKLGLPMTVVDQSHYRFTTITVKDPDLLEEDMGASAPEEQVQARTGG